jgi:hypothetical protein
MCVEKSHPGMKSKKQTKSICNFFIILFALNGFIRWKAYFVAKKRLNYRLTNLKQDKDFKGIVKLKNWGISPKMRMDFFPLFLIDN